METIRIRKSGFAVRMSFEDFYEKYEFLIGRRKSDLANQIQEFLGSLGFSNNDIQIGKTKVHVIIIILYLFSIPFSFSFCSSSSFPFSSSSFPFSSSFCSSFSFPFSSSFSSHSQVFMRNSQKRVLQDLLQEKVLTKIVLIQRWIRAKLNRCRFLHMRRSAIVIQVCVPALHLSMYQHYIYPCYLY